MTDFFRGMRLAIPIVFGYIPVGFAFGVLAVQAGLTPVATALMSLFVYAGSSQLIATGLFGAGVGMASIVLTTFIVNLRHMLMSAALTPYLRHWNKPLQAWFAFELTDESFAANLGRFYSTQTVNTAETLGLNFCAHSGWFAGTLLGVLFDSAIGDIKPLGLDFALPAMFIALILPHLAVRRRLLAVISGAFLSLAFAMIGVGQWSVLLATFFAATIAAFLPSPKSFTGKRSAPRA